jgi:hypothetical protein
MQAERVRRLQAEADLRDMVALMAGNEEDRDSSA